jgi:hypothetical protein
MNWSSRLALTVAIRTRLTAFLQAAIDFSIRCCSRKLLRVSTWTGRER